MGGRGRKNLWVQAPEFQFKYQMAIMKSLNFPLELQKSKSPSTIPPKRHMIRTLQQYSTVLVTTSILFRVFITLMNHQDQKQVWEEMEIFLCLFVCFLTYTYIDFHSLSLKEIRLTQTWQEPGDKRWSRSHWEVLFTAFSLMACSKCLA